MNEIDQLTLSVATALRQTAAAAEELIDSARREGGEQYHAAVVRLERRLRQAREDLEDLETGAMRQGRRALRKADELAHDQPYATAGMAALLAATVGVLIGVAIGRR